MTQGINAQMAAVQNTYSANTNAEAQGDFLKNAKAKAFELRDTFVNSSQDTKGKVNSALAATSALGTILTLFAASGKKIVANNQQGVKKTFRGQNLPLKILGVAVSLLSAAAVVALNMSKKQDTAVQNEMPIAEQQGKMGTVYTTQG